MLRPPAVGLATFPRAEPLAHRLPDGGRPGENGDGAVPGPGSLSLGSDGVLYGTTTSGGTAGAGVVFSLAP